jgi:hypothetical protein
MNKRISIAFGICGIGMVLSAAAQYPTIPHDLEAKGDSALNVAKKLSDQAWEKALPIVERDAKNGKPYVPAAAQPSDLQQASIVAFPGAEGGGAFTAGGRGGRVFVVTTLADSGPGSFRDACEQGGARIIVFNIAGIIRLQSPVIIRAPYITIAGQTAPGDGVCIAGESVWIDTHDVIVRYMRFRRGETNVLRRDDGLGGNPVGNIIIDHVSASWGLDENMSIYRHVYDRGAKQQKLPTVNITIQNSIFSEALDTYNHAFGSTIGGHNSTFMRNLWANNIARNPSVGMDGDFGFVNNVIFNWWNRSADGGDHKSFYSFINNYYKPGPITPEGKPISYRILKPESGRSPDAKSLFGRAYVVGNIVEGNERVTKNNWDGGVQVEGVPDEEKVLAGIRSDTAFPMAPVITLSAAEAYKYVLANAGAALPKRDPVDTRIIGEVTTGKIVYSENAKAPSGGQFIKRRLPVDSYKQGIISDISQVGGYPEYKGTPYKDADNDGIPDSWEKAHGLNPNNATDAPLIAKNGGGYSNIELYLNSVVELQHVKPLAARK